MDEIAKAEVRTIDDVIEEYHMIKSKFGEKGLDDFVKNICNISGRPTIDGYGMLIYISQEWENKERKYALQYYREQEAVDSICHMRDDEGNLIECTKYI